MEIKKDFKNNLLNRREVEVVQDYDSNPGFERVKKEVSEKFKVDLDRIAIKNIISNFGSDSFVVDFFIYDSAEDMKIEFRNKKKKEGAK